MSKGRRYETGSKLNIKKVIAVMIAIAVIVMFIIGIKTLLTTKVEDNTSSANYFSVYTNGKWGVINQKGEIIIEPQFDDMITIPDQTRDIFICNYDVNYETGTYQTKVLNAQNKEILTGYDDVQAIENKDKANNLWYEKGVLIVKKQDQYGVIDFSGKELIKPEYDEISALEGVKNSLLLRKQDKVGLADNSGNMIAKVEYKEIKGIDDDYQNGYLVINQDLQYGMIDFNKAILLPNEYEDIKPLTSKNLFVVKQNGNYQVIDKEKNVVIDNGFDDITQIVGENLTFKKNGKYGIMDQTKQIKLEAEYESLESFKEDLYLAKKQGKYGVVNTKKEEILPFEFDGIQYRKEIGMIQTQKNGEINSEIYNQNFEKKLEGIITDVNKEKGYLRIRIQDEYQYYNFALEQKEAKDVLSSKLFLDKKDGKYGYIDQKGEIIVDYIYEDAIEFNEYGFAAVKKEGKWGAINEEGKVTAETTYELADQIVIDFIGKWHLGQDLNSYYYTDK